MNPVDEVAVFSGRLCAGNARRRPVSIRTEVWWPSLDYSLNEVNDAVQTQRST